MIKCTYFKKRDESPHLTPISNQIYLISSENLNNHQKNYTNPSKKIIFVLQNTSIIFSCYMRQTIFSAILFTLLCFTGQLYAQKITLEGGYFNPKRTGQSTSETYFDAIRLGGQAEFDLKYNFGFQTGLFYNIGYSNKIQKYGVVKDSVVYNTWSHALEIPVRIVYNQPLFKDFKMFGFAGPNIQIGIIQNQRVKSDLSEYLTNETGIQSGKYNLYKNNLHRINFQLGAGGGVQWRQFILKSGYDWGLNSLDRTKNDRITQGQWYVTFGYQLK